MDAEGRARGRSSRTAGGGAGGGAEDGPRPGTPATPADRLVGFVAGLDAIWWMLAFVVCLGLAVWALPGARADRNSELGAALLGGATIAMAVLLAEERFAREAENRGMRLQLGLQKEMPGIDLRGRDLDDFHMPGKVAPDADLSGAKLNGSVLRRCNFEAARFSDTEMVGARLSRSVLRAASFFSADLTDADLVAADCSYTNFGTTDPNTDEPSGGAKLVRANLRGAILVGAVLTGADLAGADLRRADLTGARLAGASGLERVRYDDRTIWPSGFFPLRPSA